MLLRERLTASLEATAGSPWHEDHWVDRRLATRGFGAMPLALGWPETAAGRGRDILVWTVTQQLLLVSDAARQLGVSPAKSTLMAIQLRVLAFGGVVGDRRFFGGRRHKSSRFVKSSAGAAIAPARRQIRPGAKDRTAPNPNHPMGHKERVMGFEPTTTTLATSCSAN